MTPTDLIKKHRAQQRNAAQVATANRAKSQRTLSGEYVGRDGSSGESIFKLLNGETVRTQSINTAAMQPGQPAPIRLAQGGRGVSDGRHSSA